MSEQATILPDLKNALAEQREAIKKDSREIAKEVAFDLETKLLREFRKWEVPRTARFKTQDIQIDGLGRRLSLVEERLNDLDQAK